MPDLLSSHSHIPYYFLSLKHRFVPSCGCQILLFYVKPLKSSEVNVELDFNPHHNHENHELLMMNVSAITFAPSIPISFSSRGNNVIAMYNNVGNSLCFYHSISILLMKCLPLMRHIYFLFLPFQFHSLFISTFKFCSLSHLLFFYHAFKFQPSRRNRICLQ